MGKDKRGYVKVSGITNVPFLLQIVLRYLWGVSQCDEEWFNFTQIKFTRNYPTYRMQKNGCSNQSFHFHHCCF